LFALAPQRGLEAARRAGGGGVAPHLVEWDLGARRVDLAALGLEDAVEHMRHLRRLGRKCA
jgi:hypothetical protein